MEMKLQEYNEYYNNNNKDRLINNSENENARSKIICINRIINTIDNTLLKYDPLVLIAIGFGILIILKKTYKF